MPVGRARHARGAAPCAALMDDDVAALMITNPNTLGLFERGDRGDRGGGARARRARLHRRRQHERADGRREARATWASTSCSSTCTRRSRRRTAAAARAPARSRCARASAPYLPVPRLVRRGERLALERGRCRRASAACASFYGNFGMLVRALRVHRRARRPGARRRRRDWRCSTPTTCARASQDAYQLAVRRRRRMHECVFSDATLDAARRQDARRRQAPARLRLLRADHLLPAGGAAARS